MVDGNLWAMDTVPLGTTNPWVEVGNYTKMGQNTERFSSVAYCSNSSLAYDYGNGWEYGTVDDPPMCDSPNHYTITQKTSDSVFFTTAYVESAEYGFACGTNDTENKAACFLKMGDSSEFVKRDDGQCVCTSKSKTYYPLGVEKMAVAFQHFYATPTLLKRPFSGGSDNADAKHPLDTTLESANGQTFKWPAATPIQVTLSDLLLHAHHAFCDEHADLRDGKADGKCATGISLDEPNVDVKANAGKGLTHPVTAARL
jgi:hypothetical protein